MASVMSRNLPACSGTTCSTSPQVDSGNTTFWFDGKPVGSEPNPGGLFINVHGAKGNLTFPNVTSATSVSVFGNDMLESLEFPDLLHLIFLEINAAPTLKTIELNNWQPRSNESLPRINITDTPLVNASFPISGSGDIYLTNAGEIRMPNVSKAGEVSVTNTTAKFNNLKSIDRYHVDLLESKSLATPPILMTPHLTEVSDVHISNATHWSWVLGTSFDGYESPILGVPNFIRKTEPNLFVRRSIVIGPSSPYDPLVSHGMRSLDYRQLVRVGGDLNVTGNIDATNFDFSGLTEVGRLFIIDNPGSWIVANFSSLSTARSIHISGKMDTTMTFNFQNLSHVYEMTIEPWNENFNCSQLVHLRDIRIIEFLSCNGTNGTDTESSAPSASLGSSSGISPSVAAGAGVGAGLGALIIAALVYLIVHYRRKAQAVPTTGGDGSPRKVALVEPNCAALDGNQIVEGNSTCLPHQMEGAEVVEASGVQIPAEAEAERVPGETAVSTGQEGGTTPAELA